LRGLADTAKTLDLSSEQRMSRTWRPRNHGNMLTECYQHVKRSAADR
jgi:hypothetical protein